MNLTALEALKKKVEVYDNVDFAVDGIIQRAERKAAEELPNVELENTPQLNKEEYQTYDFEEPALISQLFNPEVNLHPWQLNLSNQIASAKATQQTPFKFCLTACNGSGKDAFVIAPFVIWFALTRKRSLTIITSSSGTQLTAQTENYISSLALKFNKMIGREVFKVIKRFIKCNDTGSEIRLFATDEAGKAEGYHPLESWSEMAVIINEAKSVSEEIFQALSRCTGFNYWLEVSTPGEPLGHFYWSNQHYPKKMRVTSYDCPHKALGDIDEDKVRYGEHSAIFRSKHLALFTQLGGQFVVTAVQRDRCVETCKSWLGQKWKKRVGIDIALSNGGDESVICVLQGNKRVAQCTLYTDDVTVLTTEIDLFLRGQGIPLDSDSIYIDDGGVGRAIWPLLRDKGWINVNRLLNQTRAWNTLEFANLGAELWFFLNRLVEDNILLLPVDDAKFMEQLTSRKYKRSTTGKIQLESKKEMKAEGRKSPDRVDAFVLALSGLTIEMFHEAMVKGDAIDIKSEVKSSRALDSAELIGFSAKDEAYEEFFKKKDKKRGGGFMFAIENITDYDTRH